MNINSQIKTNKAELLERVIAFHYGTFNWDQYQLIKAHVRIGGITWGLKGHEGALADVYFTGNFHTQQAKWQHLFGQNRSSEFTPERVAMLDENGSIIEELLHPIDSFKGHSIETPWTRTQLIYFSSYATWNYLTTPFNFLQPGIVINEIEPGSKMTKPGGDLK